MSTLLASLLTTRRTYNQMVKIGPLLNENEVAYLHQAVLAEFGFNIDELLWNRQSLELPDSLLTYNDSPANLAANKSSNESTNNKLVEQYLPMSGW